MNNRQFNNPLRAVLTIGAMLLSITANGQISPVHIPDPNLRASIAGELNIARGANINKEHMLRLEALSAASQDITDLTGLEYAKNLRSLILWGNSFDDLSPIANLTQLSYLDLSGCSIDDITALSKFTNLTVLNVRHNVIVDISPLSHLTKLIELRLTNNNITDIAPLANLTRLELLEIEHNNVIDHSPLDGLALSHFTYDQTCELAPFPVRDRIKNRSYPSIVARWSGPGWPPVTNRPDLSDAENLALHDLRFSVGVFGLHLLKWHNEFTISGDVDEAIRTRDELLSLNPNKIHLFTLDVREAPLWRFPTDWPGWIRDEHGDIFIEWHAGHPEDDHGLIDFRQPAVQEIIVQQAVAVSKCGLYDGVMFDYWHENWLALSGWDGTRQHVFSSLEKKCVLEKSLYNASKLKHTRVP